MRKNEARTVVWPERAIGPEALNKNGMASACFISDKVIGNRTGVCEVSYGIHFLNEYKILVAKLLASQLHTEARKQILIKLAGIRTKWR